MRALESIPPKALAAVLNKDVSTISKYKSGEIGVPFDLIGLLLFACDLKPVSINSRCVDVGMLTALEALSGEALRRGIVLETAE